GKASTICCAVHSAVWMNGHVEMDDASAIMREHDKDEHGLLAPGSEQAKVLAERLSGANPQALYTGSNTSTTLKVMGVDLVVLGKRNPTDDENEVITYTDARRGIYKKLIMRDGRLTGAILLGEAGAAPRLLRAFYKKDPFLNTEVFLPFQTREES